MNENLMQACFLKQISKEYVERKTARELAKKVRASCDRGEFRSDIDEKQVILTMITICFSNFSNHFTLSNLMGFDLGNPELHEKRKQQAIEIILSYITNFSHEEKNN